MSMEETPGLGYQRISNWIDGHITNVRPPFNFEQIVGGQSNLTYVVTDASHRRMVVRRPPMSHILPTAHDMGREYRIVAALQTTEVPVPRVLGLCDDVEVIGQTFYVMDFVDGLVLRDASAAHQLSSDARLRAAKSMVEVLARIHSIDPDTVGLGDLSRRDDYLGRQLKRWYKQYGLSKSREVPLVDQVHAVLVEQMPEQPVARITHGDFRLENAIFSRSGQIIAVLDWELCTLGDPLADVGLMLAYWYEADDTPLFSDTSPASAVQGFPNRRELGSAYSKATRRDITQLDYYIAFGFWKLACIADGVYSRYAAGAMGNGETFAGGIDPVPRLALRAKEAADRYMARPS
jgi:aminoglycoside phosphotransferase (APT) family kinase protein